MFFNIRSIIFVGIGNHAMCQVSKVVHWSTRVFTVHLFFSRCVPNIISEWFYLLFRVLFVTRMNCVLTILLVYGRYRVAVRCVVPLNPRYHQKVQTVTGVRTSSKQLSSDSCKRNEYCDDNDARDERTFAALFSPRDNTAAIISRDVRETVSRRFLVACTYDRLQMQTSLLVSDPFRTRRIPLVSRPRSIGI